MIPPAHDIVEIAPRSIERVHTKPIIDHVPNPSRVATLEGQMCHDLRAAVAKEALATIGPSVLGFFLKRRNARCMQPYY